MVDMTSPTVKAIDSRSVHQICSGQVVVTLSTAMKELVENSLDAGATNIEIRLKNYGADCIEVIDNGSGVVPENFEALALKHHTSKLNVFSDLVGVETFGFRGEALSSLCALSNLSVTTCHRSQSVGARIDYDHDGKITKQTPTARVQGTTVTIQDLFYTLPVRHKEFLRNIKREYAKLIQVLQSYCIISTGVRINCFTQSEKGKKTLVLSTNDNAEMRENISNIFGPKQLQTLSEFKQISPRPADCEEHGLDMDNVNENPVFKLTGYVSCCEHGSGRSTTERQFIFINKRPCDIPKVVRVVNEVYHGYNRNQYPFLALNISLDKELVDVNVTPDKRHIFMQQEKLLLATIKSSLKAMFDPGSTSYSLNDKPFAQIKLGISKSTDEIAKQSEFSQSIKDRLMQANSMKLANLKKKGYNSIMKFAKRVMIRQAEQTEHVANGDDTSAPVVQEDENSEAGISQDSSINEVELADCCEAEMKHDDILEVPNCDGSENSSCQSVSGRHSESSLNLVENDMEKSFETVERCTSDYEANVCMSSDADEVGNGRGRASGTLKRKFQILHEELPLQQDGDNNSCKKIRIDKECDNGNGARDNRKSITVQFDWDKLGKHGKASKETYTSAARIFRAPITPEDNQNAEDELQRHITKDKFNQMEIIGQFNQGFIISKLRNDLFIIDQHASDEKYNFEEQQKNTVLKSQRLIRPQALDLTAVNEGILIDNIEVFHKNGFDFEIDEEAPVSKKVKLVSVPVSRNWSFGKSDIDELIFMLSDNPGMMYRPSSVRKMFAMRACRMSIMVGRALDRSQMKRILGHMGEMDHPWNCPHGRPTMRHLVNLNMVRK